MQFLKRVLRDDIYYIAGRHLENVGTRDLRHKRLRSTGVIDSSDVTFTDDVRGPLCSGNLTLLLKVMTAKAHLQ